MTLADDCRELTPMERVLADRISQLLSDRDRLAAIVEEQKGVLAAQEARVGPSIGDDPLVVANRWNGNSGTSEPDFDMDPEDTASFLAAAVIRQGADLASTRAELEAWKARVRGLEGNGVSVAIPSELFEEGFWRPCSGCHESSDGYPTGPYNAAMRSNVGGGCHECGGIGAVWEQIDAIDSALRGKGGE